MTKRGDFEQFLDNPLPFATAEVRDGHAEALKNPTREEESMLLLVRGCLRYADQHRTDFAHVGKALMSAGKALQGAACWSRTAA